MSSSVVTRCRVRPMAEASVHARAPVPPCSGRTVRRIGSFSFRAADTTQRSPWHSVSSRRQQTTEVRIATESALDDQSRSRPLGARSVCQSTPANRAAAKSENARPSTARPACTLGGGSGCGNGSGGNGGGGSTASTPREIRQPRPHSAFSNHAKHAATQASLARSSTFVTSAGPYYSTVDRRRQDELEVPMPTL